MNEISGRDQWSSNMGAEGTPSNCHPMPVHINHMFSRLIDVWLEV